MTEKNDKEPELVETERVHEGSEFSWSPPVDIYESADAIVIEADMPGVDRAAVDVKIERGVLTIAGRTHRKSVEDVRQLHEEFVPADYYRVFQVDEEIDEEGIEAVMKDGVLTVSLPRSDRLRTRKVEVK